MLITDLSDTRTVCLAIGDGSPLAPLTSRRTVAALPFGGTYRVIDFALSNCLHSGLRRVLVLTQFNPLSLHNHLRDAWSLFNAELGEYVMPVTPPIHGQAVSYSSSANALFHNLYLLEQTVEQHIMVVSGEQIYRMDYAAALSFHMNADADVTAVCIDPRHGGDTRFRNSVIFGDGDDIKQLRPRTDDDGAADEPPPGPMGIYIFKRELLLDLLQQRGETGTHGDSVIALVGDSIQRQRKVLGYRFGGDYGRVTPDKYWRTLPTLDQYYEANMDLLRLEPLLDLYQTDWPIRSYQMQCPPARTVPGVSNNEGICVNSIVASGTVIAGGGVNQSVLSNRIYIDDGAIIEQSILFPGVKVGENARLHRVICDRGVEIPANEVIGFDAEEDRKRFQVTDNGIVVISRS
ncbi:MAG: glucose-1-phosphate adenylyltransferase [Gammaproteobacteria bacterium]|nr:glucose-1-phosphate adenylyltransferase [Gammaproteobacteria bacterium]